MNDYFVKNKLWIGIFLLFFVIFIILYFKYSLGLFFDIPSLFFGMFFSYDDTNPKFLIFMDTRARFADNFLVALFFNTFLKLNGNLPIIYYLKAFSSSYFLVHLLLLIMNYCIARRTKRYDIAVICFLFYALFSIPNAIWAIREIHIAILFYFAILSYLLSYEKLGAKDIIPIIFIIICLYEAFETTIIFGPIIFLYTILYLKKYKNTYTSSLLKIGISISLLFASVYTVLKTLWLSYNGMCNALEGLNQWIGGFLISFRTLFHGNMLILLFALIAVFILFFIKKELGFKNLFIGFIYIFICLLSLYKISGFIPDPGIELQNYSYALWFIFPVIISILALDYFKIKLDNYFYSNLLITACVFGVLNLLWQINTCFEFAKYENYLKNLLNNSKQVVVKIPDEDLTKYSFLKFNTCFGVIQRSIFLIDNYVKDKIIVPSKNYCDYSKYCFDDIEHTYYDKTNDILYIQTAPLKIKTKYWELTPIKEEFEKTGRVNI